MDTIEIARWTLVALHVVFIIERLMVYNRGRSHQNSIGVNPIQLKLRRTGASINNEVSK